MDSSSAIESSRLSRASHAIIRLSMIAVKIELLIECDLLSWPSSLHAIHVIIIYLSKQTLNDIAHVIALCSPQLEENMYQ